MAVPSSPEDGGDDGERGAAAQKAGRVDGHSSCVPGASSRQRSPCPTPPSRGYMENIRPVGMRNLGNTCFLNAAAQALAHAPLLGAFFLRGLFVQDLNAANPLGHGGALAVAFAALMQSLFPQDSQVAGGGSKTDKALTVMSPDDFYAVVCKCCPLVGEQRGAQQDAHEVMSFLLDAFHEDLNRTRRRPPYQERRDLLQEDLSRKGEERYAAEAWHDHLLWHRSMLVDLCQGQLRSEVRCIECDYASITFDPFLFLSLPLPPGLGRGGREPIEAAFRAFCTLEHLVGDDSWGCPRCRKRVNATKRLSLWKLPLLLLVHLKRFGFDGVAKSAWNAAPRTWKIEGEVSVPMHAPLDLRNFVAQTSPQRTELEYDLFAVVDHVGASPSIGHYTAACRRPEGWWRFDDSRTEFLGPAAGQGEDDVTKRILSEANYLLLFQRRDAPSGPEFVQEQSHKQPQNWPHVMSEDAEWSFLKSFDDTVGSQSHFS